MNKDKVLKILTKINDTNPWLEISDLYCYVKKCFYCEIIWSEYSYFSNKDKFTEEDYDNNNLPHMNDCVINLVKEYINENKDS